MASTASLMSAAFLRTAPVRCGMSISSQLCSTSERFHDRADVEATADLTRPEDQVLVVDEQSDTLFVGWHAQTVRRCATDRRSHGAAQLAGCFPLESPAPTAPLASISRTGAGAARSSRQCLPHWLPTLRYFSGVGRSR